MKQADKPVTKAEFDEGMHMIANVLVVQRDHAKRIAAIERR